MGLAMDFYQAKEIALKEYARKEARLSACVSANEFPWRVTFYPEDEISIFDNHAPDETGEIRNITISTGLTLDIQSTLGFRLDAAVFKRLISLADKCGQLYYVACREEQFDKSRRLTRPCEK